MSNVAIEHIIEGKRLGAGPAKSHPCMLSFSTYANKSIVVPPVLDFWKKRKPFPIRDYGNNEHGCCTIASQAVFQMKMERLERRNTEPITREEVLRVYFALSQRLYGGVDEGAYELDALNNWRNKDLTFRNSKGNPLTIDAFTRVNHTSVDEVKRAIFLSGSKGVKVCFALPMAWANTLIWDIPAGQQPIGSYRPYSWGGHSMTAAVGYDKNWCYLDHTWNCPMGKISWNAFSIYATECFSVVDSMDYWRKKLSNKEFNTDALRSDVNSVSDVKIK